MKTVIRVIVLLLSLGSAAVVRVPSQQPNIQAGLDAALTGDTVLVAGGTYIELLAWPGRAGDYARGESGPDSAVIDGLHKLLVVRMDAMDYTNATVLCRFTISRGEQAVPGSRGAGSRSFLVLQAGLIPWSTIQASDSQHRDARGFSM